jgi:hypothetical protein
LSWLTSVGSRALRGVKLALNGELQLPKNNVLFKVFSSYFFAEFHFFSIPVFAPSPRQVNPSQEQREFLLTQRHSSRVLTVTRPAEAPPFEPFEARNTLPPVVVFFIDWELGANHSPCGEPFSQGARLSRSEAPRGAVSLRA